MIFWPFTACVRDALLVAGLYCMLVTRNLIRALIGVEILTKAVTLLIILAGYVTGQHRRWRRRWSSR